MFKLFEFLQLLYYDFKHPPIIRPYGITCYVGLPGCGKTLSMAERLLDLKLQFPKAKIYTNFGFKDQDGIITRWEDLVTIENGEDGVIFGLDEVHDIFNRKDWADMPSTVLTMFSQNRKMAKQFICTAQSFADVGIDLRRRCHYIIECSNIRGRWVFQRAFLPTDYAERDGTRSERRRAWRYNFIADNEIYESYDTYALIKSIRSDISKKLS